MEKTVPSIGRGSVPNSGTGFWGKVHSDCTSGSARSALIVAMVTTPATPHAGKLGEHVAVVAPSRPAQAE
jgi:hypothetical protein